MTTAMMEVERRAEPANGMRPPPRRLTERQHRRDNSFALKNWRVRTRLLALILLPTAIAVILGGLRVVDSASRASEFGQVAKAADLVAAVDILGHELQLERDLVARFVAVGRRNSDMLNNIHTHQEAVNAAADQVRVRLAAARDSFGEIAQQDLNRIETRLNELKSLRDTVLETQLPPLPTIDKYQDFIADLLRVYDTSVEGVTDEGLSATLKALGSLAREKEEVSKQRALLSVGLARDRFDPSELDAFTAAKSRQDSEHAAFLAEASPAERQQYNDIVTGQLIDRSEFFRARALALTANRLPLRNLDGHGSEEERWFDAVSSKVDLSEQVLEAMTKSIVNRAGVLRDDARTVAIANVTLVVAVLVLVLIITLIMARSLVRPLRRLRGEALEIAGHRLPGLVKQLRESDTQDRAPEVNPIGVDSTDEVGEVARAFDEVHREAVRLAGEEARLRSNINAMFVNLSRRSQTLVERQITLIDGLEQGEQDEQRLGNLFKLDHLATRMRRNSENLLVLAGQEPARRWTQPVELTDVVRAALSEVEGYERVMLSLPSDVAIVGQAVNDVIHLMAELVENALSFSSRDTKVMVSGNRIDGGGMMVAITDAGIGMTPEEIGTANYRLAHPPTVDVSVSRRMGLFVVARLALRNGIRVQLRPHDTGGLTAMILLPESLLSVPAYAGQGYSGPPAPVTSQPWAPQPEPFNAFTSAPFTSPFSTGSGAPLHTGPLSAMSTGAVNPMSSGPMTPGPFTSGAFNSGAFNSGAFNPDAFNSGTFNSGSFASGSFVSGPSTPPPGLGSAMPPTGMRPRTRRLGQDLEAATGPLPAIRNPRLEREEEYLPIYASIESAWFRKSPEVNTWSSPERDTGWQTAAQVAQQPSWEGNTGSGLPKRVPKANLVPGSADLGRSPQPQAPQQQQQQQQQPMPMPMPVRSPDRARNLLSGFQQGVRRGRAEISGTQNREETTP
ncbi:nitrate- and nitrite sensing domain-containing protein [Streptosporangiaceae bacterium NEAU-GS5]|nr:nitrate- and nitrite sensing domain-containing protein [Streptosporangiaceae bacterium NEAU-GS5]